MTKNNPRISARKGGANCDPQIWAQSCGNLKSLDNRMHLIDKKGQNRQKWPKKGSKIGPFSGSGGGNLDSEFRESCSRSTSGGPFWDGKTCLLVWQIWPDLDPILDPHFGVN